MMGIGRTSTQTTLASIETTGPSSPTQSMDAELGTAGSQQSNPTTTLSPSLWVNTSVNSGHLSTITEGNSPARQSPAGFSSSSPLGLPSERSPSIDRIDSRPIADGVRREALEGRNTQFGDYASEHQSSAPRTTFWAGGSRQNFRNKIRSHIRKPRKFTIRPLGIKIEFSSAAATSRPQILLEDLHHEDSNPSPSNLVEPPYAAASQTSNRSAIPERSTVASPVTDPLPGPRSGQPDPLIGLTPTPHEKHERLRVQRREATLKRKAEMMARCECNSECQCRHGSVRSNAASYDPGDSDRSIHVPDHVLGLVLGESSAGSTSQTSSSVARASSLAGLGVHFEETMPESGDVSNVDLAGRQSFDDQLSQASTAIPGSNGSSISLVSRRPSPIRRANTTPGPMRRATQGYRPGVLEALQNSLIPDQMNAPGPEVSNPSRNESIGTEEASTMAEDGRANVPDVSSSQCEPNAD
ncbi:MAG: hypothetical protein Q9193_003880 [Seirophora villosa]